MHGCLRTRINETSYNKSPTRKSGKKYFLFLCYQAVRQKKIQACLFNLSSDAQSFAQTNYGHLENIA